MVLHSLARRVGCNLEVVDQPAHLDVPASFVDMRWGCCFFRIPREHL